MRSNCLILWLSSLALLFTFYSAYAAESNEETIELATQLATVGKKHEAIDLLLSTVDELENEEEKVQLMNIVFNYYYELNDHSTLRKITEESIASVNPGMESYFRQHSQAFGFLARYYLEQEKNQERAKQLLHNCVRSEKSEIRSWCFDARKALATEARNAFLHKIDVQIGQNTLQYWLIFLGLVSAIGIFTFRTLFDSESLR